MTRTRRRFVFALILSLILLAVSIYFFFFNTVVPDAEDASSLLAATLASDSFRYTLDAAITTADGDTREYFTLAGAVNGNNSMVSGTILGSGLELAYVDGVFYQQGADGQWQVNDSLNVNSAARLFAELDPAAAFANQGFKDFAYLGALSNDLGRVQQVSLIPAQTGWVADYFANIVYTLDIDRRCRQILRARVDATLKENAATTLSIAAEFSDLGREIEIIPPVDAQ